MGGGAVGYAATGTMDGALMGASMGQAIGGAFGNFAVACFTAGTPLVVDREGNSRPIDEIEVGDFVLARSEFDPDGPLELKRVEEKFVRTSVVMELVVHGQSIKTTAEHPFYVPAQGKFVAAGELQVGEQLVGHDGKLVEIESIGSTDEITTVYNLRVADFHTYFVGGGLWGFDVWVHNAGYTKAYADNFDSSFGNGAKSQRELLVASRPERYRSGVVEKVWKNAEENGRVFDPNTLEELFWDRAMSRHGQWDMGHLPGKSYDQLKKRFIDGQISRKEFLDEYNNAANYRPEAYSANRSNRFG